MAAKGTEIENIGQVVDIPYLARLTALEAERLEKTEPLFQFHSRYISKVMGELATARRSVEDLPPLDQWLLERSKEIQEEHFERRVAMLRVKLWMTGWVSGMTADYNRVTVFHDAVLCLMRPLRIPTWRSATPLEP